MLNTYKLLLMWSFFKVSYCCQGQLYEQKIRSDIDYTTKFIYTWLVVVYDRNISDEFGISYGSIIHPKAVLTVADDMERYDKANLFVQADCDVPIRKYFENCTTRDVMKVIYPDGYNNQPTPNNSYTLLIIQTPFDITPAIKPITLASNMELVHEETCMVLRWLRLYDETHDIYGVVPEAFHLPYVNGTFDIDAMSQEQMEDVQDFIIREDFFYPIFLQGDILPLNFFGSPLVCLLKNNDSASVIMPSQVGISTLNFQIPYKGVTKPTRSGGSSFLITDFHDEIMKKLEENFT